MCASKNSSSRRGSAEDDRANGDAIDRVGLLRHGVLLRSAIVLCNPLSAWGGVCVLLLPGPTDQPFSSYDSDLVCAVAGASSGPRRSSHVGAGPREWPPASAAAGATDRGPCQGARGVPWAPCTGGWVAWRDVWHEGWCRYGWAPSRSRSISCAVVAVCPLVSSARQPAAGEVFSGMIVASTSSLVSLRSIALAAGSDVVCCSAPLPTRSPAGRT